MVLTLESREREKSPLLAPIKRAARFTKFTRYCVVEPRVKEAPRRARKASSTMDTTAEEVRGGSRRRLSAATLWKCKEAGRPFAQKKGWLLKND